jgi:L-aspartate oxidase
MIKKTTKQKITTDILIIGSGIAGLSLALKLAKHFKIILVAKSSITEGSSQYAQGGIAGVLDPFDSVESHIEDTIKAGAGLCKKSAVRIVAQNATQAILKLIKMGVPFSKKIQSEDFHLTKEGGHSHRRIIHASDHTGKSILKTLIDKIHNSANINILTEHMSVDLIYNKNLPIKERECIGGHILDKKTNQVITIIANYTVLATGGASKCYLYTSNPDTSTGDGIAMAWRAGCKITNMEFNQFHPTCLFHPKDRSFLITEALRGEGAVLKLPSGKEFMQDHDLRADLAPRDIVARAIDYEMKKHGIDCVFLDISHKKESFIKHHFPTIYSRCLKNGIDITKEAIPVVPAAHYTCGGIHTNLTGQTNLNRLFAIGETAYTGLHGANRLASNSLAEGLVFAELAYQQIKKLYLPIKKSSIINTKIWDTSFVTQSEEKILVSHDWDELRRVMWDYVGIVRTDNRLRQALKRIKLLREEVREYFYSYNLSSDLLELRNLTQVSEIIVKSAIARKESRGLHYNINHPHTKKNGKTTSLQKTIKKGIKK